MNTAHFSAYKALFLTISIVFYAFSGKSQQVLEVNHKPLTFPIKSGETRHFVFSAEKDKAYTLQAEQKGIDIVVTLKTAQGRELHRQDSPNGLFGPETVELKAEIPGEYHVYVAPLADTTNAGKGKFSIQIREAQVTKTDTFIVQTLTPRVMRKDLEIFRGIREKANSGFYRYRSRAQMDSLYARAFSRIAQPMPIQEFYKIILALTDFEGSCHNSTHLPHPITAYWPKNKGFFPFYLRRVGGGMYVNETGKVLPLGTRIVAINGVSDTDIRRALYKYSTSDGYTVSNKESFSVNNGFGWRFPFEFGFKDTYNIRYVLPGAADTQSVTLNGISMPEKQADYRHRHSAPLDSLFDTEVQDLYSFRMLDAQTGLLNIREFTMAANEQDPEYAVYSRFLDSVFTLLKTEHIPNLILDIRNNPGGSNPNDLKLFTYLAKRPFRENKEAFISFKKVPYPQYFVWNSSDRQNQKRERKYQEKEWNEEFSVEKNGRYYQNPSLNPYWYPDSNRFTGNTYVLIDENVGSAASHFAAHVRDNSDAVLIGNETVGGYYEHNGHIPVEYRLPGSGIVTRFSIVCVRQDVSEHPKQPVGHGVMPDYQILPDYNDFLQNRDTQLEFTLRLIRENGPR